MSGLRHRLEHMGVTVVRGVLRVLPAAVVRGLGAGLGLAFYALDRVHRNVADTNLATAFPKRSPKERRQITRAMFMHFGRLLFELLRFSTFGPEAMRKRLEFEGEERARAAYAQGKGVLFFTGHFGYGKCRRSAMASRCSRWGCLPGRSTTRCSTPCSNR